MPDTTRDFKDEQSGLDLDKSLTLVGQTSVHINSTLSVAQQNTNQGDREPVISRIDV
jgi:hypothetical protein